MNNKALFFVKGSAYADLMDISSAKGVAGSPNVFALNPAKFSGKILEDNGVYVLKDEKESLGEKLTNSKLTVALDKKSLQVKSVCIEDESGDVTTITLFDVQSNLDIPHAILSFELPEGVKINQLHKP
jgi:outer membrane lipoprotein-sorting protein